MRRILCLGDSNTCGYDPRSPLGARYPSDVRWTGRLQRSGWEVVNRGVNGICIPVGGQIGAVAELLEQLRPLDAVTVMYGTNDILQGGSAEAAGERMAQFLRQIRPHCGESMLLLIAPPPLQPGDWVLSGAAAEESRKLSACYRRVAAQERAAFADAGEWHAALAFDGVHLTPEGHAAFFAGLAPLLPDEAKNGARSHPHRARR